MIKKEIAAHLLAYNLVRTVMIQAACYANAHLDFQHLAKV